MQVEVEKVLFHLEIRAQNTLVNALLFQTTANLANVLDYFFLTFFFSCGLCVMNLLSL